MCPAYVLDPKLQNGKKLLRWSPRSKFGQFLGSSKYHAESVGLIRNLRTGKVSPQYHVVYDNHFTTVDSETQVDNITVPKGFNELMKNSIESIVNVSDMKERTDKDTRSLN